MKKPLYLHRNLICLIVIGLTVSRAVGFDYGKPFWEGKPKLEAKLRDERAILVSVRTEKGALDPEADLFTINGVGWVKRDAETVFQLAQQFDRMKEVSEHFREVKYDPKTHRVFVICQALGYQARMLFDVTPTAAPVRELQFKVIDGHFLGLHGVMGFQELSTKAADGLPQTQITLRIRHEAREIPIPRALVGFALEVLVQKVAGKMREHFETAKLEGAGSMASPKAVTTPSPLPKASPTSKTP